MYEDKMFKKPQKTWNQTTQFGKLYQLFKPYLHFIFSDVFSAFMVMVEVH